MKARIIILTIGMALTGCGLFRSSKSSRQLDQSDSTIKTKTQVMTVDTGTITTHERNDYVFLSPEFKASSSTFIPPLDLIKKLSTGFVALDTGMLSIKLGYDSLKQTLNVNATKRPESGHGHQEKTTVEKKGQTVKQVTDQKLQVKKKAIIENKESKPDYAWITWLIISIAFVAIIFIAYRSIKSKYI